MALVQALVMQQFHHTAATAFVQDAGDKSRVIDIRDIDVIVLAHVDLLAS
jgi:hypothetical protein